MSSLHVSETGGFRGFRLCAATALFLIVACLGYAQVSSSGGQTDLNFYYSVRGYGAGGWFGEPVALALDDRAGLIYVADQKSGVVDAFSLQGVPKFQYGAATGLKAPIGLAVDSGGNVFVSENDGGPIKIIDSHGKTSTLEIPAVEGKETPKPGRLTIDRDGTIYVVDRANCQVVIFDKERKLKLRFGSIGDKRGEFKLLESVAVDRQGRMYAVDSVGVPVQVFDRKGGYIQGFGVHGDTGDSLAFPTSAYSDRLDQIWIVDKTRHCIKVFDRLGTYLKTVGTYGQEENQLFYPIDAVGDSLGRVYVLEFGARRLQVFRLRQPFEPFSPGTP